MEEILALVEARLRTALGEPDARAAVTFLGTDRIEVLRFLDGSDVVRYATLGMSAQPMADPSALLADPAGPSPDHHPSLSRFAAPQPFGPRAELVLSVRAGLADTDGVLRTLAVLAASPQVEGVVVAPGGSLDVGGPLWPGAPFHSVLVGEPGGLVPDLELAAPMEPVRFLPLLPMTPNEAAWKRVRGAAELEERWLARGTDLRDPLRRSVALD
ncbi:suppressor of fused domain protein [Streptomyces sp. NPDC088124]|uniref:suppressor of fused domain protein n=1 Tax=Streptomyces sp. NPDC088124 TaxID=3154654 RepID=UPI0034328D43